MSILGHVAVLVSIGVAAGASSIAVREEPPATMKAVRIHDFGGAEKLKYEDVTTPKPGAGEVLVKVRAAGVNPVDWKMRDGLMKGRMELPFVLGFDVSGSVESVGEGVTTFKAGDEVFAYLALDKGGGYAEYAVVPVKDAAVKPAKVDHKSAAATPLAALTAWQALFDHAKLEKGQTVLIHGAAGGVGHFAVQLAKWKGAKVIATASEENATFVKNLGADQVINYKTEKFETIVKDADVVFDMIGAETLALSYGVLKKGGYLVSIVSAPDTAKLGERGAKGSVFLVKPDGVQLAEIAKLMEEGKLKADIRSEYPLKDADRAQEESKSGRSGRGKIVLTVP